MKKLVTIALLAAMLLSCFAGCAMQKGEIDVEAYAGEAGAQNVEFRTELDDDADKSWEGIVKKDMNGDGDTKDTIDAYGNADFSWCHIPAHGRWSSALKPDQPAGRREQY